MVSFGDDMVSILPYEDDMSYKRYEGPTETILCVVKGIQRVIINCVENFPDKSLSQEQRDELVSKYIRPLVRDIVKHSEIKSIITNLKDENLDDRFICTHQVLFDFANTLLDEFKDRKQVVFVRDGYIGNISQCLYLSFGKDVFMEYENMIQILIQKDIREMPIKLLTRNI